jgi:ATP-binding cassette subfamily B protein RaxB
VLLARALYRRPQVLFLDEAFDQLDVALERRITSAMAGRSIAMVVVSHREETVAGTSRKIVLTAPRYQAAATVVA